MREMFFCYEKTMTGKWEPVVYYDNPPAQSSQGKESTPRRSNVWKVPGQMRHNDEPRFALLCALFPPPPSEILE